MIRHIPAENRHFTNAGWLQTFWLFSFSDYYDPKNVSHGALRVFNDDIVAPQSGFPDHPHISYQIVTIVLQGELTHWDDSGNKGVIKAGDVQRMSAGSGIFHSEFNYGNKPVHLYQIWIAPEFEDANPSYEQRHFNLDVKNQLILLVSRNGNNCISMNCDASIYHGNFQKDQKILFTPDPERKLFIYLTSGEIVINNEHFSKNDQARIEGEMDLQMRALADTEFVLIDVPD
jgi:redox-sensitive bicupin YhaK (pirin superfamily)